MNKTPVSMWEENLKKMAQERVAMVPVQAMLARLKRDEAYQLARASAPVINITVRRYS